MLKGKFPAPSKENSLLKFKRESTRFPSAAIREALAEAEGKASKRPKRRG